MIEAGDTFGEWTVLGEAEKPHYWTCQCSCGRIKDVYGSSLRMGKSKSCGHLRHTENLMQKTDKKVLGNTFGRLTPLKRVNTSGRSNYLCQCECGNKCEVAGVQLLKGDTRSCGCLKSEKSAESMAKIMHKGVEALRKKRIDGTITSFLNQKVSKNSSTSVKGVSKLKSGKYRAYISLRGKQKHLGTFATLEEAQKARLEAEEKYYKPIIDKKEASVVGQSLVYKEEMYSS